MTGRWNILLLAILAGLTGCGRSGEAEPEAAHPPEAEAEAHVVVRVEPARLGTDISTVEGLGRCEALPDRLATLTPAVEGHVHELLVRQGDPVEKGQPIVELDRAVALADLAEKTATRDALKASLELLKSLPRPEERRSNELAIEQAKLSVERTARVADQLRPLLERREISPQQMIDADQAVALARLQQQTAESLLKVQMIGPRPEAIAEAEARMKTAEGAIALSKAHLEFHTIRSPIVGVLDSLTCHPGQTIAIGTPIGEVVDTRQVLASVWLPPRSALSVRVGQTALIKAADASEEDGGTMTGRVAYVGRVADPQTGNLPVQVLVENPKALLTLGQAVRMTITVAERANVLTVPSSAIVDEGEGPILSVVRDGKAVTLHPEIEDPRAGRVAVSKTDLKAGEPVIVEGGYHLPDQTPVKVAPAPSTAPAPAPAPEEAHR